MLSESMEAGTGGGGGIALYHSIKVFGSAEPSLSDIAPSSVQAITEQLSGQQCDHC